MITRVKGTQDFLDMALFSFIVEQAKQHLELYHYTHIETPIIEPLELFQRLLGEHTDVVTKEMYVLDTAKDSERICLRPEATASIARAFVEEQVQTTPWKVFTYGPIFRHERPQKGRYRQFHQLSMEIIGSSSVAQDVQLIKMLDRFFHQRLRLNNYALVLNYLGCRADFMHYKTLLHSYLNTVVDELCNNCKERKEKNVMRVLDCKNESCQKLYEKAPQIAKNLCAECTVEWQQVQDQLELLSVSFVYRPTLVRGLDYYSKTVFEFVSDNLGAQNTFCAGGRYDQLIEQIGGKEPQPASGAAFGIERVMLLLEPHRDSLPLPQPPALHLIIPCAPENQAVALMLADQLQAHNFCTDILLEGGSMKSMMRKAGKSGAAYCLLIGEQEQATKQVTIKNMVTGEQELILQTAVIDYLRK